MADKHYWLKWKCDTCGTLNTGSRKPVEQCSSCGASRKSRYLPWDKYEPTPATDPTDVAFITGGPRWQCDKCGSFPAAGLDKCPNCGDVRGSADKRVATYDVTRPTHSDRAPIEFTPSDREDPTFGGVAGMGLTPESHRQYPDPATPHSVYTSNLTLSRQSNPAVKAEKLTNLRRKILAGLLIVLLAVTASFLVSKLNERYEDIVPLTGVRWERTINIQQYLWVRETSLSGFPEGSRDQDRRWEVVGSHTESRCCHTEYYYVSVPDGETCTTTRSDDGNGGMTERQSCSPKTRQEQRSREVSYNVSVDDYGYRYYFEIQRWVPVRSARSGGLNWEPFWQEFVLASGEAPERESGRAQNYCVSLVYDKDRPYEFCTGDEALWRLYREGAKVTFNGFGTIVGDPAPLMSGTNK